MKRETFFFMVITIWEVTPCQTPENFGLNTVTWNSLREEIMRSKSQENTVPKIFNLLSPEIVEWLPKRDVDLPTLEFRDNSENFYYVCATGIKMTASMKIDYSEPEITVDSLTFKIPGTLTDLSVSYKVFDKSDQAGKGVKHDLLFDRPVTFELALQIANVLQGGPPDSAKCFVLIYSFTIKEIQQPKVTIHYDVSMPKDEATKISQNLFGNIPVGEIKQLLEAGMRKAMGDKFKQNMWICQGSSWNTQLQEESFNHSDDYENLCEIKYKNSEKVLYSSGEELKVEWGRT